MINIKRRENFNIINLIVIVVHDNFDDIIDANKNNAKNMLKNMTLNIIDVKANLNFLT